jgi:hypothetical protein
MNNKHVAEFISKATDFSICSENDDRVKNFLKEYDVNGDGFVEEEQFLQFYLNSSINKKTTVFDNLRSLGYGKDLRLKVDEKKKGNVNYKDSIRYKLIMNGDSYSKEILIYFDKMTKKCNKLLKFVRDPEVSDGEKKKIRTELRLVLRWSTQLKRFIYTMPPSISIIEDILFNGLRNFDDLEHQGQVGFYKLVVLFSILFKSDMVLDLLQIVSEGKSDTMATSNDNLRSGKQSLLFNADFRSQTSRTRQKGSLGHEHGVHSSTRVQDNSRVFVRRIA